MNDIGTATALELGRRLAAGDLNPVDLCQEFLARACGPAARHVFITLTADRALREAAASAERYRAGRPLGPLDGVPVTVKDVIDVEGVPTTAGSALRRDVPPAPADAPVVRNLAAAGMVCLGKTNLTELAYSGIGLNPHFGTPHNPCGFGPARVPGGSSSGAAVAVAVGAAPCSVGTDTSGSVRVPASWCGLHGFKPTGARFDRTGVFPLAPTLDSVGVLARDVADVVALDAVLRGRRPPVAAGTMPPSGVDIVVPDSVLLTDADHDVRDRFDHAIEALARTGARVQRRPVPALDEVPRLFAEHGTLVSVEAHRTHADLLRDPRADLVDRRVLRRLREGATAPPESYAVLLAEREKLRTAIRADLGDALLAYPTVRGTAPELGPLEEDDELFARTNRRALANTMVTSFLDMPGLTLPIGVDDTSLPVGLLLSAPSGADDRLLTIGQGIVRPV